MPTWEIEREPSLWSGTNGAKRGNESAGQQEYLFLKTVENLLYIAKIEKRF